MTKQTSRQLDCLDTHLNILTTQVSGLRYVFDRTLSGEASNRIEQCKGMVADFRQTMQRMVEVHDGLIRALNAE
jgi:hypothetical protein